MERWVQLHELTGGVLKAIEVQRQAQTAAAPASRPHHNDNEIRGDAPVRRALNE